MNHYPKGPGLIVTRTPLRVSFAGGGTDLPAFYEREPGAVLSSTIDKYLYVTVKRHVDLMGGSIRLNYSETEIVDRIDDIKNSIARECLRLLKVEPPIYISTVADLPASSGLGSSSSFAVGLLNALHVFLGDRVSAGQLAEEACQVEIEILQHPVGRQDQYAAAFGGLNYFSFMPGGQVTLEPQRLQQRQIDDLFNHIMVFWTGLRRDSNLVLEEQARNTPNTMDYLLSMRGHAQELRELMRNGFTPSEFGMVLDATWHLKSRLASTITNEQIDTWYDLAMSAGAAGGKLLGAGGGGFLLFIVKPDHRDAVRVALGGLTEISIGYEAQGSRVILAE